MNKEDFVSLECAKLLKEKGFNEPCLAYYWGDTFSFVSSDWRGETAESIRQKAYLPYQGESYFAPTLYEVQKWLRTKWQLHVDAFFYNATEWKSEIYGIRPDTRLAKGVTSNRYPTYESALNAGIIEALKMI